MDNQKIADYLSELVDKRNSELVSNQELNNWSESQECYWQDRTDSICKAIQEISSKNVKDEKTDYKAQYAYLAAEFDNYKKRVSKSESYAHDKAFQDVILHFLDVYDDMERLYEEVNHRSSFDIDDGVEMDLGPIDTGFEIIFEKFEKTLDALGCKKIDVQYGNAFDVNTMEAVAAVNIPATVPVEDSTIDEGLDENDVYKVVSTGWKYKETVIRPAKVVVAKTK